MNSILSPDQGGHVFCNMEPYGRENVKMFFSHSSYACTAKRLLYVAIEYLHNRHLVDFWNAEFSIKEIFTCGHIWLNTFKTLLMLQVTFVSNLKLTTNIFLTILNVFDPMRKRSKTVCRYNSGWVSNNLVTRFYLCACVRTIENCLMIVFDHLNAS